MKTVWIVLQSRMGAGPKHIERRITTSIYLIAAREVRIFFGPDSESLQTVMRAPDRDRRSRAHGSLLGGKEGHTVRAANSPFYFRQFSRHQQAVSSHFLLDLKHAVYPSTDLILLMMSALSIEEQWGPEGFALPFATVIFAMGILLT